MWAKEHPTRVTFAGLGADDARSDCSETSWLDDDAWDEMFGSYSQGMVGTSSLSSGGGSPCFPHHEQPPRSPFLSYLESSNATSTSGEDAHPPTKKQTSRRLGLRPLGAALKRRVRFLSLRAGKEEAVRGAWPSGPAAPFPSPLDAWVAGGPHLLRTTTLDSPEVPAQLPNSAVLDEWVNSRLHLAAPGRL